ncbi:MAG: acyl-CoA thioesterase [Desulfobulbus sp.]
MNKLSTSLIKPVFTTSYRVIYGDTDAAGVMYNANYLRLFEIGRTEMMRAWAMPYRAMEELGCILPVTESYLRFKAPARYDDLVDIAVCLVEVSRLTCRFHYQISRHEENGPTAAATLLTKGFTVHACVNREGVLTPFPQEIALAIKAVLTQKKNATSD